MRTRAVQSAALGLAAAGLFALSAAAQGPPRGGPGGRPGGPPPRGMMRFGPGRTASVGTVPIEYLAPTLKLTAAQKTKLTAIQTRHRDAVRKLFPTPPGMPGGRPGGGPGMGGPPGRPPAGRPGGGPGPGGPRMGGPGPGGPRAGGSRMGGPQDQKAMEALIAKVRAQDAKTDKAAQAVLTPAQRPLLKKALADAATFRRAGIPLQVVPKLKLTDAQKKRIAAATAPKQARTPQEWMENFEKTQTAVRGILTAAQRKMVEAARPPMPRGFGGPGMGRPGMGGPGGTRRS